MLYGHNLLKESAVDEELKGVDLQPYVELFAYDDISRDNAASIKEFCASPVAQVLLEKQVLNKGTMMRLSKADDEKRRIVCEFKYAKENDNAESLLKEACEQIAAREYGETEPKPQELLKLALVFSEKERKFTLYKEC